MMGFSCSMMKRRCCVDWEGGCCLITRFSQMDLIDWLDEKRVIRQQPPSQSTQHRLFIIEQLKPIMRELEALELSALTISS
jgi:hypothetical protein